MNKLACRAAATLLMVALVSCGGGGSGGESAIGLPTGQSPSSQSISEPGATPVATAKAELQDPSGIQGLSAAQADALGGIAAVPRGQGLDALSERTQIRSAASYSIGGSVSGLTGTLRLRLNGIDEFTVNGSGSFTAPIAVIAGNPYEITLVAQPVGFTCAVIDGAGIARSSVTTAKVICAQLAYTLGGNITGLKGSVVLHNDGIPNLTVSANGAFTFRDPFPRGSTYAVSVKTMPATQTCVVSNGSGSVTANVSSITVDCTDAVVPVPPPPPPNTPMKISSYGVKAYNFSWQAVPGATYYTISQEVGGAPFEVVGDNLTGTTFSRQNMVLMDFNSHLFTFKLRACNTSGCSNPYASFVIRPDANNAIGYLKPSTGSMSGLRYGQSVALSKDGNWLVVAATFVTHAGFIEIYSRRSGQWAFETRLKASNAEVGDNFGSSLSISKDGSTILVGASGEASSATKVGGDKADNSVLDSGAAYVFERTGTTWAEVAYLKAATSMPSEKFGSATALSADGSIAWVAGNGSSVHGYRKAAGTWSHFNSASSSIPGEGRSLAVSDDGATLAVGMPSDPSGLETSPNDTSAANSGAVLVLKWSIPMLSKTYYLKEYPPQSGNKLGASVAISADGNSIAAGVPLRTVGPEDFAGGVTFFNLDGSGRGYVQDGYVFAPQPKTNAEFGRSVALSSDGKVLVAGGPVMSAGTPGIDADLDFSGPNRAGVIIRFVKILGGWLDTTAVTGKVLDYNDFLGQSISVSGDGKTIAAGAPGEDSLATGIGGDATNNGGIDVGAAYLY